MARNYSDEEVEAIFRRALERQVEEEGGYGHEELIAAAREVGLDDEAIDRTLREIDEERGELSIVESLDKKARRRWLNHLVTYLVVAGGFLGMHALGYASAWVIWMAFGWGMGLALDTFSTFRGPTEKAIAKERKRLNRKSRRAAQVRAQREAKRAHKARQKEKRARRERNSRAGEELERVIEEGVSLLLGAASRKLREATRSLEPPAPQTEFERFVADRKRQPPAEREVVLTPPPPRGPRARVDVSDDDQEVEVERQGSRKSRSSRKV